MSDTNAVTTLVWNERTKLLANALDRASTALGTGSVFPLFNSFRASQAHAAPFDVWFYVASGYVFIFGAMMLHLVVRRVLRVLR